jgi:hypothetical protein
VPPPLTIRFRKEPDGAVVQTCTRPDGSVTWQRLPAGKAGFFPKHDLTHFALETVLGHRLGFYGLLAQGWGFADFSSDWPRGRIPVEADPSELLVGFLDAERIGGARWTAAEMNDHAARFFAELGASGPPVLTDDQLERIRARMHELFEQWDAVPPGRSLELSFELTPPPAARHG